MPEKLKIVEFRGVGGLQGRQEAKDQAIYDNFQLLFDELNELKLPKAKVFKSKKEL